MSRPPEKTVRLSVLDRLIDENPGFGDAPSTWVGSVSALKRSVLRDLEWLLNTRRIAELAPDHLFEVKHSVYHFGIPDVTSLSADSFDVYVGLARDIEECIRIFEPRLFNVRVAVREPEEKGSRTTRFVIDAMLRMDPDPERIMFDTVLDTPTGKFFISGDENA